MDKPSTSTAEEQAAKSGEPSLKKQRLSTEPLTLKQEFKALRDEYDEHRLDEMVQEKQLTEVQRSLLHKLVPKDMTRSKVFLGKKHRKLARLVNDVAFDINKQNRRIVGVVQPFGAGKTKTALMLSRNFVVLPIRWTEKHVLLSKLEKTQRTLFKEVKGTDSAEAVQDFSDRCQRLVGLAVLSVAAVFRKCAKKNWFDAKDKNDRLQFGILAISEGSAVISEMTKWFEAHAKQTQDEDDFNDLCAKVLNDIRAKSDLRLVFVIDEIQQLRKRCRGYCVHRSGEDDDMEELEFINNWKGERRRRPAAGHTRCTDLFYQICCLMADWLGVEGGFVVCSTMFKTWTKIEDMGSPLSRDVLRRFTDTHWLSATDCRQLVQHYFAVSDEQLDALDLKLLTRPVFANDFVLRLRANLDMLNSTTMGVSEWLEKSFKKTVRKSVKRLRGAGEAALKKNRTRKAMDKLVTHIRVCACVLERDHSDDESEDSSHDEEDANDQDEKSRWDDDVELVSVGLLKLEGTDDDPDQVEIADPLAERASLKCYKKSSAEVSAVRKTLAQELKSVSVQDESHKGYVFEQVLAYLALRGLIRVPKYAADGTVTDECVKSTAKFAGQYKQIKLKIEGLTEESEPSFVCDLLSECQLPEYVYLPTTSCKPDVLFRANRMIDGKRGGFVNVVIQSKVEDNVLDYSDFLKALASLDPAKMYGDSMEKKVTWQQSRGALREVEFMRIVFAAAGFNAKVQHVVHEYNLLQARRASPSFIHLLNLQDLRNSLGITLYSKVKGRLTTKVRRNLVVHDDMPIYKSAWKKNAAQAAMTKEELVKLCSSWGILPDKTKNTAKSEADLREKLVVHETKLAKYLQELAVSLDVGAGSAQGSNE